MARVVPKTLYLVLPIVKVSPSSRLPSEVHTPFVAVAVIETSSFVTEIAVWLVVAVTAALSLSRVTVPVLSVESVAVASIVMLLVVV